MGEGAVLAVFAIFQIVGVECAELCLVLSRLVELFHSIMGESAYITVRAIKSFFHVFTQI
jgi:hypothetical protein